MLTANGVLPMRPETQVMVMNRPTNPVLMTTSATIADHTNVCTIGGEIDALTAPAFQKALLDSVGIGGSTVIDMTAVTFFGIAGIGALIAARDFADRRHCALCLDGSYCVTRVLEVVGLASEFDVRRSSVLLGIPPGE
ncbi:STAS domain-containing protein [Nocardia sp. NPDC005746]|uniref:STAS domain-containing protein n=1 Tax=Nocardia sp. NPDC005746 TaxID=3157062 RepID=UPI0033FCF914